MALDRLVVSLRLMVGIAVSSVAAEACELEGDPPTLVPLATADDALHDAYCERMFDCSCEQGRTFDTLEDCRSAIDDQVANLRARAEATGLTYDPSCLGSLVDGLDELGCARTSEPQDDQECQSSCRSLHGSIAVGQRCTDYSGDSDCASGLACTVDTCDEGSDVTQCTGVCTDPCAGPCPGGCTPDQRCDYETLECVALPGLGDSCQESQCAAGLGCLYDPEGGAQCVTLPELGESCGQLGLCADTLRCEFDPLDGTGTCVGPTPLGDACSGHSQCGSGFCPAGFCAALPGKGESCGGTFACAAGLDCDLDTQVCIEGDALICGVYLDVR